PSVLGCHLCRQESDMLSTKYWTGFSSTVICLSKRSTNYTDRECIRPTLWVFTAPVTNWPWLCCCLSKCFAWPGSLFFCVILMITTRPNFRAGFSSTSMLLPPLFFWALPFLPVKLCISMLH